MLLNPGYSQQTNRPQPQAVTIALSKADEDKKKKGLYNKDVISLALQKTQR